MGTLEPGVEAPDFELSDAEGQTYRLSDLRGGKVVLYFYPADHTPGCTREACDFRDSMDVWQKSGYTVLGVSPMGAETKRSFIEEHSLNFPLLIDADRAVEAAYDTGRPQDGEPDEFTITTMRSTFVIDEHGKIEHALYGVGSKGHVDDLRSMLGV